MDNPLEFTHVDKLKLEAILEKLIRYMLLIWSGNFTRLWIPSSSPHRFHERNLHICKDIWENIYCVYVANYLVCVFMKNLIIMAKKSNLS